MISEETAAGIALNIARAEMAWRQRDHDRQVEFLLEAERLTRSADDQTAVWVAAACVFAASATRTDEEVSIEAAAAFRIREIVAEGAVR